MAITTKQMKCWQGSFGKSYIDRNAISLNDLDTTYKKLYGITITDLNNLFMGKLNRNIKILEVGSNIGNQLLSLQKMGFKNLYGIEINKDAIELAKTRAKDINIIYGSALDIPFKDNYFDLVFTSGVLIHISPKDLKIAIKEIYRCSSKYIRGYEYYSKKCEAIVYRGKKNILWRANFPKIYTDIFPRCKIVKLKFLKCTQNENVDVVFLLKKR
jgi:pseudaminic acid biosynthesis-associated methylase